MALMNFGQKYHKLLLSICLFFVAFLPRAIYPMTPNLNWYGRSIRFWNAVLSQDWLGTYQQYHPGVTTMWLSGLGIRVFGWYRGYTLDELLDREKLPADVLFQAVGAGVKVLAVGISLGIVLIYLLLALLIDKKVAFVAAFFIAADPVHLALSKFLHLDAIMSVLMLITLLFLLLYRQRKKTWILIVTGLFTGFSLLTKSPTGLIIPIGVLIITGSHNLKLPENVSKGQWQARLNWFGTVVGKLLIWGGTTVITFFVFWPGMWVVPQEIIRSIRDNILIHILSYMPNPIFFNGETYIDPGVIYYGAIILLGTTLITFSLMLVGVGKLLLSWRQNEWPEFLPHLWIFSLGLLFLVLMGVSATKAHRYLLPVFLTIDLFAAIGLVQLGSLISNRWGEKQDNLLWAFLIGGALLFQAVLVFPHHPYYGNHYNLLFGGVQQGQNTLGVQPQTEGIDLAGQYLDSLPGATQTNVAIFSFGAEMLYQHFGGNIRIDDEKPAADADYRVYYTSQITRGLGGQGWKDAWEADQLREPDHVIEFDNIPYVWIYKTKPDGGDD